MNFLIMERPPHTLKYICAEKIKYDKKLSHSRENLYQILPDTSDRCNLHLFLRRMNVPEVWACGDTVQSRYFLIEQSAFQSCICLLYTSAPDAAICIF